MILDSELVLEAWVGKVELVISVRFIFERCLCSGWLVWVYYSWMVEFVVMISIGFVLVEEN